MKMQRLAAAILLSSTITFMAPVVSAASVTNSTVTASVGDVTISSSETKISGDNIKFAQVLSTNYNRKVTEQEVIRLKADFDFGFGEISLLYATAVYSGQPVDEIGRLRLKNMGWGEIAKLYGVKVKDLKKGNYDVVQAARHQGVDITYIEVEDNSTEHNKHEKHGNAGNDDGKKDNKKNDKHENSKGNGHRK
ncbi:hypothetical protein [Dendrosporobacter sp. 1207_IL3150]|uniref:hypothetical protein n=1 Tax=Dendrosporobacter sp. 1207_IL3150 TaxID=3084054 RepID=UPI002FD8F06A